MAVICVNSKVTTPLGEGVVQGAYAVTDAQDEPIIKGAAVRLPVNEETRKHLNKSNCLTPHAMLSGVWVFQEGDLK